MAKNMSARQMAFSILRRAGQTSTYSNIALDRALSDTELSTVDRGLVTAIVMGVVERRLTLDFIIDRLASNPEKIDGDTRVILRMGVYQLVFLDRIPEYAAVNESVSLAPRRSKGFVNAILRSLLRLIKGAGIDTLFDECRNDAVKYLSLRYSFPEDMCEIFTEIYGRERAERIFEIFNAPPSMTLRINTLKTSVENYTAELMAAGIEYTLSKNLENAVTVKGVGFDSLPHAGEGYFFVQDEASQTCAMAVGAKSGELIIDACSCPGSKSFGMAINMQNAGKIKSFDLHESKLSLVRDGAERLGIDIIEVAAHDARECIDELVGAADRVLCDVPCSGLGVIAKKPEIRYKSASEFARLPEIQYAILENCSKYVKLGGSLVYSTCTVLPAENECNVQRFLCEHPEFEAEDFTVGTRASRSGMLSLAPDVDGTDGFFIAKMKRKEN
jgi:16S rRNA (cytosine967-C5)-methyltransferase